MTQLNTILFGVYALFIFIGSIVAGIGTGTMFTISIINGFIIFTMGVLMIAYSFVGLLYIIKQYNKTPIQNNNNI